ncbi:MAG: transglycosylase domain-containing protein [Deltaproteobacteria bacterium]|nr:transglycosylase domain-containing protein [Deltaproteobacteria bacterium]
MPIDRETIRRRKRIARLVLGLVVLALVIGASAVMTLMRSSDRMIADRLSRAIEGIEERTGFEIDYQDFQLEMTHMASLFGLRVTTPGATGEPFAFVDRVDVEFELTPVGDIPVKLNRVRLRGASMNVVLDEDGRPNLPTQALALLDDDAKSASDDEAPDGDLKGGLKADLKKNPNAAKALVRKAMAALLGLEIVLEDGRVNLVDRHFARRPPGRLSAKDIRGKLFVDLLGKKISADAKGELADQGGGFDVNLTASSAQQWIELTGRDLSLAPADPYLPEGVRVGPQSRLQGSVSLSRTSGSKTLPIKFDGTLRDLEVENRRLASQPVRDVTVRAKGRLTADLAERRFVLSRTQVFLGPATMTFSGRLDMPEGAKPFFELTAMTDHLPLQDALDALPRDFAPVLQGAVVEGEMDGRFDVALDFAKPSEARFNPQLDVRDLRVITPPPRANITKLNGPFRHTIRKNGKVVKTITVGPEDPDFVRYEDLGENIIGAVLTCEDGGFFRHHGFSLKHIRDSIRTNLRNERFVRGASTLSMQTTKNLWLSHEKTLSRKFQEMLLTWWMEEEIPKKRILEIYMNIIEWGPEIYGIGPAARHYFGKKPKDLSPLQAAFLGSIISNPVKFHDRFYKRGYTGNWGSMLQFILSKMAGRGTITHEMVDWCEPFEVVFSKDGKPAPGGCKKPEEDEAGPDGETPGGAFDEEDVPKGISPDFAPLDPVVKSLMKKATPTPTPAPVPTPPPLDMIDTSGL